MDFAEALEKVLELLQRQGRVSYGALKRRFELTDDYLQDLKDELLFAHAEQVKDEGPGLVWTGTEEGGKKRKWEQGEKEVVSSQVSGVSPQHPTPSPQPLSAERRQLTVMFCDLVGSTALSARLDPEDYRALVQQYQQICSEVIQHHEGYLAQYLGDGLLVYFGYPTAHEDDARRAVRVGLEIISALSAKIPSLLVGEGQGEGAIGLPRFLPVRIGIHTGLVVIGEIGNNEKRELLALGETPNIAARIQSLAEPNTVIVSAATQRLIEGQFESQPFGTHLLKGLATPIAVYHVQSERQASSLLAGRTTLTPLVGREREVGLLIDRWEQAKEGRGQVVLLSGEPGIGKSRLAYTLREHVTGEGLLLFEARCSPYHQHSAFYPLIDVLQRTLLLSSQDTDSEKVKKLERILALYNMHETLPLFTALLSLPPSSHYPPLNVTPQKQKERTLQALVQLLVAQAERQATVSVWEDLHWADPSSLEFLSLLIEQLPTTNLLLVLTFRPEFAPTWKPRSHISQLMLNRLGTRQVEAMIEKVAESKSLSADVVEQIRVKTDGVPLFIEEITKSVIEAATNVGARHAVPLQTIPATLQEALLARLDRLSDARQVAQLGATLGREFSYELLQAVTPLSEADLHAALAKLVEAEILYQRGIGEHARYFFKHALIQDTAYQSLLKSTRQQYHQQIAQILEARFLETKKTQPELLAHHYTEAGLIEQAIPYWQQAGQKATERSANTEAISHLTKGLELLQILPDTLEHVQQELTLQIALGVPLRAAKGFAASEVGKAYARARELSQRTGETSQLFPVLRGLWEFYELQGELQMAREIGEQLLTLAQHTQDPALLLVAHDVLGDTLVWLGEFATAREHLEQGIALYDTQQHRSLAFLYGYDSGMACLSFVALALWYLGHPDQALKRSNESLLLARELSYPHDVVFALCFAAYLHTLRGEARAAQERAEVAITLSTEQEFPLFLAWGTIVQGWVLAEQGQVEEGIAQIRQGLAAWRATGAEAGRPYFLSLLAEAHRKAGQTEEGLAVLAEALAMVDKNGERQYEAELYRLKGELLLAQESREQGVWSKGQELENTASRSLAPDPRGEAEDCLLKAIDIAQKQQAKSLELRAVMSLVRLRQRQTQDHATRTTQYGSHSTQHESRTKLAEAHKLLSEIYHWFTEGFDAKDLQEAKALLREPVEEAGEYLN